MAFSLPGLVIGTSSIPCRSSFNRSATPFGRWATGRSKWRRRCVRRQRARSGPSPCRWRADPGFMTGAVLGFAHTVGELGGIVLMIGGNIPGKTKVISGRHL